MNTAKIRSAGQYFCNLLNAIAGSIQHHNLRVCGNVGYELLVILYSRIDDDNLLGCEMHSFSHGFSGKLSEKKIIFSSENVLSPEELNWVTSQVLNGEFVDGNITAGVGASGGEG